MSCKVLVATFQFRRREHCDCKFEAAAMYKPDFIRCFWMKYRGGNVSAAQFGPWF